MEKSGCGKVERRGVCVMGGDDDTNDLLRYEVSFGVGWVYLH